MANNDVDGSAGERGGVGDKFDAVSAQGGSEKIRNVIADFAGAGERGQVPAGADAVFEHDIGGAHIGREFLGAQLRDPRKGGFGHRPLFVMIALSRVAAIVAHGLIRKHAASLGGGGAFDNQTHATARRGLGVLSKGWARVVWGALTGAFSSASARNQYSTSRPAGRPDCSQSS